MSPLYQTLLRHCIPSRVPNKKRIPNQGSSKQAIRRNYHVKAMLGLRAYLAARVRVRNRRLATPQAYSSGRSQRLEGIVVAAAENALSFAVEVVAVLV